VGETVGAVDGADVNVGAGVLQLPSTSSRSWSDVVNPVRHSPERRSHPHVSSHCSTQRTAVHGSYAVGAAVGAADVGAALGAVVGALLQSPSPASLSNSLVVKPLRQVLDVESHPHPSSQCRLHTNRAHKSVVVVVAVVVVAVAVVVLVVGRVVGAADGAAVGNFVGTPVGDDVGPADGIAVGTVVGALVGVIVGAADGADVGGVGGTVGAVVEVTPEHAVP
jgi:hypothetical protein